MNKYFARYKIWLYGPKAQRFKGKNYTPAYQCTSDPYSFMLL